MAKADWKKIAEGKYGVAYENEKNKDVLSIRYAPEIKFVEVREENGYVLLEKEFKTRNAAINYGEKIMRKN